MMVCLLLALAIAWPVETLPILGNSRSRIYHWVGCPSAPQIAPARRVVFRTVAEAEQAGYRPARNCPTPPPPQKETPP